ncbi:MutS-related protein [Paenibacillus eucommiae]|uniref:DNA mismatch repair proteins mutS family domain-containing protein n=1 Tax=Paenibacillus eucommiae TaxID=1355755 RepID=A0ABS4INQ3_9BACL|nr:hypothetical protein [Paenibacillus eucommiae]MBP1989150.1 hypothetical protein [Paenibacillus eucommiae]
MEYTSILFEPCSPSKTMKESSRPDFFHDIHMDSIIRELLTGKEEYELTALFYEKLPNRNAIQYRIAVMKDMEYGRLIEPLAVFSQNMRKTRQYAAYSESFKDKEQQDKWLADGALLYCQSIRDLHHILTSAKLHSAGMRFVYNWLTAFIDGAYFSALYEEVNELQQSFERIQYSMLIADRKITIFPHDNEMDYCQSLSETFQTEKNMDEDFTIRFFTGLQLSGLEADVLNILRKQQPEPFRALKTFGSKYKGFIDPAILTFARELQFYLACLQYFQGLQRQGLHYCYPTLSDSKELHIMAGYDLSLASSLLNTGKQVICNDFDVHTHESIFVLTGPNQGGKTTFARSLGQILHLASIGCPVPCQQAELFALDQLFTHFPSKEHLEANTGQLQDELLRLKPILNKATGYSVIILNEIFATTSTLDAHTMSKKLLDKLRLQGTICLFVTHLLEIATSHKNTVSLVAAADPNDPAKRTFLISRKVADGLVYASSIASKYGLTPARMKERIQA